VRREQSSRAWTNGAETRNDLVRVLGVTATQVRTKLGESKDSIARFNQPLELATSSSPDALQFLALAYQSHLHGDLPAAMADYNRAIEKDPNLALAYAAEGVYIRMWAPKPARQRLLRRPSHYESV